MGIQGSVRMMCMWAVLAPASAGITRSLAVTAALRWKVFEQDRVVVGQRQRLDRAQLLGHHLAVGHGLEHLEIFGPVDDVDVGIAARRQGPDLKVLVEGLGGVEGHHLDRRHEVDALLQGQAHQVVHVALVGQHHGRGVVGAPG